MARNDRYLSPDDLRAAIEVGQVDTVIVAFTDMQGRLQGKRMHGRYYLDIVADHGTEGCNYLLGVDVEMNTVGGYAITSWDRGYGDMEFVLDTETIRWLTHLPATAMVQCGGGATFPLRGRTSGLAQFDYRRIFGDSGVNSIRFVLGVRMGLGN